MISTRVPLVIMPRREKGETTRKWRWYDGSVAGNRLPVGSGVHDGFNIRSAIPADRLKIELTLQQLQNVWTDESG